MYAKTIYTSHLTIYCYRNSSFNTFLNFRTFSVIDFAGKIRQVLFVLLISIVRVKRHPFVHSMFQSHALLQALKDFKLCHLLCCPESSHLHISGVSLSCNLIAKWPLT